MPPHSSHSQIAQQQRRQSESYTTIPISFSDVISRSFHNLSSAVSRLRPWPEFFSTASIDRPASFNYVLIRIRKNVRHFRVNYALVVSVCASLSLIGTPFSLIVIAAVVGMWLLLHFFREDPLVAWGQQHVGDRTILLGLVLLSIAALWLTGVAGSLIGGVGFGVVLSGIHGALRNPEDLFLDEDEAASASLISPGSAPRSA